MTPENGQELDNNYRDSWGIKKQNKRRYSSPDKHSGCADAEIEIAPVRKHTFYEKYIKRLIDIILSACGIVILLPFFALIALAIVIDDPGPVFFTQKRIGRYGQIFTIAKFRTMRVSAPHNVPSGQLKNPELHITRVGRFLRKSSVDELPQLFQIFTGKMSIIGPRPLIPEERANDERKKYGAGDVRPGLAGWAQINGRDRLSDEEKARYDGEYVQKMSFLFDCKCFFLTIGKVIKCADITEGEL